MRKDGILPGGPMRVCGKSLNAGWIFTSHTYREETAQRLYPKLEGYAELMEKILIRLKNTFSRREA